MGILCLEIVLACRISAVGVGWDGMGGAILSGWYSVIVRPSMFCCALVACLEEMQNEMEMIL